VRDGENALGVQVQSEPQMIAELLGEVAGVKAIGDARNQARFLRRAQRTVLETAAHHRAGALVPDALGLGLDERNAGRKRGRLVEQKPVGEMVKGVLVERAEIVFRSLRR